MASRISRLDRFSRVVHFLGKRWHRFETDLVAPTSVPPRRSLPYSRKALSLVRPVVAFLSLVPGRRPAFHLYRAYLYVVLPVETQAHWVEGCTETRPFYVCIDYSSSTSPSSYPPRARPRTEARLSAHFRARAARRRISSWLAKVENGLSKNGVTDADGSSNES